MAKANGSAAVEHVFGKVTSYSYPFMTLTAAPDDNMEIKADKEGVRNKGYRHFNPFICEEEPVKMYRAGTVMLHEPPRPEFSSTNPFANANMYGYCCEDGVANISCPHVQNHHTHASPFKLHQPAIPSAAAVETPYTNPFSPGHLGSFIQSTPVHDHPPCSTCPGMQHTHCTPPKDMRYGHCSTVQFTDPPSKGGRPKSRARRSHRASPLSSESEDDGDRKEKVPTLRPGTYDGATPWREFLHRFESCAEANYWSEKTMAVQLKFCLVGTAGSIVHKNPRSSQWDYGRLVEEMETAYGPSSQHATVVALELRRRVRQVGEALHVLRDDIYDKVSIAYGNRTETEQDAIGVEVFTTAVGDAEIVQKLLEQRPRTLAQAYDVARRHETTKQTASYVTSMMQAEAHGGPVLLWLDWDLKRRE